MPRVTAFVVAAAAVVVVNAAAHLRKSCRFRDAVGDALGCETAVAVVLEEDSRMWRVVEVVVVSGAAVAKPDTARLAVSLR